MSKREESGRERSNDVRHRESYEKDLGGVDNPSEEERERERGNDVRHRASHEADLGGVDHPPEEGLAGVAAHPSVVEVGNGHIPAHWAICK